MSAGETRVRMPHCEKICDLIQAHAATQAVRRTGASRLTQGCHVRFREAGYNSESRVGSRTLLFQQACLEGLDVCAAHNTSDLPCGDPVLESNTHERLHKCSEHAQHGFFLPRRLI